MRWALVIGFSALTVASAVYAKKPLEKKWYTYDTASSSSLFGPEVTKVPRQAIADSFQSITRCTVERSPQKADYFLHHSDDFATEKSIHDYAKYLSFDECFEAVASSSAETHFQFKLILIRRWLAEQSYLADNVKLPRETGPAATADRIFYAKDKALIAAQTYSVFADCIVARDAAGADRLGRTKWNSADELASAQAMAPALSGCVPVGAKMSFRQEDIRGLAAQGLWQRYEAIKPASYEGRP